MRLTPADPVISKDFGSLSLSTDGTDYVVVWTDSVIECVSTSTAGGQPAPPMIQPVTATLKSMKISGLAPATGTPRALTPGPSTTAGKDLRSTLAYDGLKYLLVWTDMRTAGNWNVSFMYLNTAGEQFYSDPLPLLNATANQSGGVTGFDTATGKYHLLWMSNSTSTASIGSPSGDVSGAFIAPMGK